MLNTYTEFNPPSKCQTVVMLSDSLHCGIWKHLPYLFVYKSHSSIRRTSKIGSRIGYKIFSINNLKLLLELHKDTHSDHKSSSLTVVKRCSRCLHMILHVFSSLSYGESSISCSKRGYDPDLSG